MTALLLVVFALITVAVVYRWWVDRDRRRHGELPKADTYVPVSNCRLLDDTWPDPSQAYKEQLEADLGGHA